MKKWMWVALALAGCAAAVPGAGTRGTSLARVESEERACHWVPPKNIERVCRNDRFTLAKE